MNKAVFFDRDGTLNSDEGQYYVYRVNDFRLNPGVTKTLHELVARGYLIIVISNQGGIAKGEYTCSDTEIVHQYMTNIFSEEGIALTETYYCPHHEKVTKCLCRKPLPLLIEKALARFDIDASQSWFVGDASRDIDAARSAGIKGIKIDKNSHLGHILNLIP